ncbi:hypothetical protein [Hoeflea ulvae]|uniref:Baseplate protein J-like domain-containing protein n=1 Tax=Hoeflea ulvae TaxID=2983764 RepID=A0ABT3YL64_9HYPH|nr:hypothetical protein [Hoeflea ulvae]MCY0096588.1 hypothetical protein [Hoeflea ulvae]
MAERPQPELVWDDGCPDCGTRNTALPSGRVPVLDDFDWSVRDFEGFRRVMLEELAAADPAREKWTQGDHEIVLVEVLAAALDRSSHALDDIFYERFLETARRPASVVRLLEAIDGRDAAEWAIESVISVKEAEEYGFASTGGGDRRQALLNALAARPDFIPLAKAAGSSALTTNIALITQEDVDRALLECPAVVQSSTLFSLEKGLQIYGARILLKGSGDLLLHDLAGGLQEDDFTDFRDWYDRRENLTIPPATDDPDSGKVDEDTLRNMTIRTAIKRVLEPLLPVGSRFMLTDGKRVGLYLRLCVKVASNRYKSEMQAAVRAALRAFFDASSWPFGLPIRESDVIEAIAGVDGVEGIIISRINIVGRPQLSTRIVEPLPDEAIVFDFESPSPTDGYLVLEIKGGRPG